MHWLDKRVVRFRYGMVTPTVGLSQIEATLARTTDVSKMRCDSATPHRKPDHVPQVMGLARIPRGSCPRAGSGRGDQPLPSGTSMVVSALAPTA